MNTNWNHSHSIEDRLKRFGEALQRDSTLADAVLEELSSSDERYVEAPQVTLAGRNESSMFQRLRKDSVSGVVWSVAVSLLIVVSVWSFWPTPSVFAQVAANVRRATSYSVDFKMIKYRGEIDTEPRVMEEGTLYWRQPNGLRREIQEIDDAGKVHSVNILFSDQKGISWDNRTEKFWPEPAKRGRMSPLMALHDLGKFATNATRELGEQEIDGTLCDGFEIHQNSIDASTAGDLLTLWIDRKRRLPVRVTFHSSGPSGDLLFEHFSWNLKLHDSLFTTNPPNGFSLDKARLERQSNARVAEIVRALRIYSELSSGTYPQSDVIYGDVVRDQMFEFAGYKGDLTDYLLEEKYQRIVYDAGKGFAAMTEIMRDNTDASYYGSSVSPNEPRKILFQWRLDDGRYQVIYGDLSSAKIDRP